MKKMRVFYDTEFIEDGKTIDLISIGMVREDGRTYYAESSECDLSRAEPWVVDNVISLLEGGDVLKDRATIAKEVLEFCGPNPEFWTWFGAYDHVSLCQLYGKMINGPLTWPMYSNDLRQSMYLSGVTKLPPQTTIKHHALNDALWTRQVYDYLYKVVYLV